MIDLHHPLAVLANRMPWQEIEAFLVQRWARQVKAGKKIEDLDLFGPVSAVAGGGVSNAGRSGLPTRLMVALLYLKHAFNESDEDVIQHWGETPTWQYFSGNEYFEHQWLCDPTLNWGASVKLWAKRAWKKCSLAPRRWRSTARRWTTPKPWLACKVMHVTSWYKAKSAGAPKLEAKDAAGKVLTEADAFA
jgi:hypothetical protein